MRCSGLRWMTNAAQYPGSKYWEEEHDLFIRAWTPLLGLWAAYEILRPVICTLTQVNKFEDLGILWGFADMDIHLLSGDLTRVRAQWGQWRTERKWKKITPAVGKAGLYLTKCQSGCGDFPLTVTTICFGKHFKRMLHFLASIHHFYFFPCWIIT